jgi:glucosamine--fructose-6-phosphate aminotransferase (isomerizing)
VAELMSRSGAGRLQGGTGIAHTRWATHGAPAVHNAHPHFSHGPGADAHERPGRVALVHNGIIENHDELRAELQARGYVFTSQTDTEVIAHLVDSLYDGDLFDAVKAAVKQLHGAYAIAVFCKDEPHRVVGARAGSPLILGVGKGHGENFLASDAMALAGVTDQIVYLEEGDVVDLQLGKYWIVDKARGQAGRARRSRRCRPTAARPSWAPTGTTCRRKSSSSRAPSPTRWKAWRHRARAVRRRRVRRVQGDRFKVLILACGTSYYSGCTAKYWLEASRIPTQVEMASEYRYRESVPDPRTLVVTITQAARPPTPWPPCAMRSRWA